MKNRFLIYILFLLFLANSLFSQSWQGGMGLKYLRTEGSVVSLKSFHTSNKEYEIIDAESSIIFCNIDGGVNIPFYSFTDNFSVGMQGSIYGGIAFAASASGDAPVMPALDFGAPVYLTLRFGAGSQKDSNVPIGMGGGLGYEFSSFIADVANSNPNDNGIYYYTNPTAFFEIVFDFDNGRSMTDNFKIRFEKQLGIYEQDKYFSPLEEDYGYTFTHSTISFIKFLDYKL